MAEVKGYKVFDKDWKCRGYQYKVGEIFEEDATPSCCNSGFHFCTDLKDCFNYYSFNAENKVAEVIALGEIDNISEDSKCCTNKIEIMREITWEEVLKKVNTGKNCTGDSNSGNWNSGNWNSGDWNSGDWNKTNNSSGCFNTEKQKIMFFDNETNICIEE